MGDRTLLSEQRTWVSANIGNDRSWQGVRWVLSGPGDISDVEPFSARYRAPTLPCREEGNLNPEIATATIRAQSAADPSKYKDITVTTRPYVCP